MLDSERRKLERAARNGSVDAQARLTREDTREREPDAYAEAFILGYLECALWSSTTVTRDDDGEESDTPLDDLADVDDIAPDTLADMRRDCLDFIEANRADLEASGLEAGRAGHDFWLTRNGHGAGFWDEGLGELGERLSDASKPYGGYHLDWDGEQVYGM